MAALRYPELTLTLHGDLRLDEIDTRIAAVGTQSWQLRAMRTQRRVGSAPRAAQNRATAGFRELLIPQEEVQRRDQCI
jgi:hypothetical protein